MTIYAKDIKMGSHFGYVSDNLGKTCYPYKGKPNIDLNIKFDGGDILPPRKNLLITYNIWVYIKIRKNHL